MSNYGEKGGNSIQRGARWQIGMTSAAESEGPQFKPPKRLKNYKIKKDA